MKIKFIPLLLLGSIFVEAQITSTNGASVYVSPNTLVYSTGDVKVSNTSGVFTNEGNIEISGGTITSSSADKFVLTYTDTSNYGQLIIKSATAAGSKADAGDTKEITVQKNLLERITDELTAQKSQINFGVPFVNYTFSQLTKDITGNDNVTPPSLPCAPPWQEGARAYCYNKSQLWNSHPLFVWNYNNRLRWDPYDKNQSHLELGKRYIVRSEIFKGVNPSSFTGVTNFKGIPYVAGQKENIPNSLPYQIVENYNFGNGIRESAYGVRYYTYLEDPFALKELETPGNKFSATTTNEELEKVGFANNILYATNPYTSNLNLATLTNNFDGMIGAAVSRGVTVYSQANSREDALFYLVTRTVGGQLTGDIDQVTIIPPMSTFIIKTNPENNKTNLDLFSQNASLAQTFDYPKKPISSTVTAASKTKVSSFSSSQVEDLYQLNLIMSVEDKISNTYLATADEFTTGQFNDVEASLPFDGDVFTSVYTIPESKEGGINPGFENSKLYINTMNVASSKVAIPVGVNISGEDKGKRFTFTSELRLNQVPLSMNETNYPNPDAKFYFHDKATNIVKEIDQNFTYSVNLEDSTNDRFEIFWSDSGLISSEEVTNDDNIINDTVVDDNNNSLNNSNTINSTSVYKSGSDYKVRFNSNWKKADITIFNVVGQLISNEKNVNTQIDYLLPIFDSYSSVYVVVIVNSITGEKIIKKIVK
ncbi:hypothetical protein ETU08_07215 [Apibacter muscae]|uniref:T9SS type A sorting domain-containing protein n=1 Tax=Apibacter muscae TaxID=2509004 RepID=A0A563DBW7_9FLAO|nr:hypothetical protein [Apibacter muscae]TWP27808.1 hypothetical protein ETU09_06850 [Apibacter muscae]TWP29628.1 hypothetical protein ETU08_07215 [Apibacter muscae]